MVTPLKYSNVRLSPQQVDLPTIAQHLFSLMLRNVSSDGFVFTDPNDPKRFSKPGCIIASPSFPADLSSIDQNYVFNWTRDAAAAAMELAAAAVPTNQQLIDYVTFAQTCQNSGPPIGYASYTIEGEHRPNWSEQTDGPALQSLAILRAYPQLDAPTRATAQTVISDNVTYLLNAYKNQTQNLWEERTGYSFFARSVQLRCFSELANNTEGIPVSNDVTQAIIWLQNALQEHWNSDHSIYVTFGGDPSPPNPPLTPGYDPNTDIVMACVYGAIPATDTKLLATAAKIRSQWADDTSPVFYPINVADDARALGPLMGRYPSDTYDGDIAEQKHTVGHPWALCTANFAELYYRLATAINDQESIPYDVLSASFFTQVDVTANTNWADAVTALQTAGDKMLNALTFHSDHLELSEQLDRTSGYEKSVANLTWSYAAFLSAVRAKTGFVVHG